MINKMNDYISPQIFKYNMNLKNVFQDVKFSDQNLIHEKFFY